MPSSPTRKMYMGVSRFMIPVPKAIATIGRNKAVAGARAKAAALSATERRVHHFVVEEMAVATEPITIEFIAQRLELPPPRVAEIVDKLEAMLTFVYREGSEGINWAYPLSLVDTGHEITANTGQRFFAA